MSTIKTRIIYLIEGTEEYTLNIKANADGEIDDDDFEKQEEELLKKLEKKYPDLSISIVEIDCEE